jgi:predicted  nucleic acid-binding Zn-ribbon protein
MKANMMRTPLIKSAVVLLFFVLLAYLTSVSSEGSVLSSVGTIIIGAFRLVQWAFAMAIGLTVCIAFLVGIFLFAVYLVSKETAVSMYEGVKRSVVALCAPVCSCLGSLNSNESQCSQPVQTAAGSEQLKDDLQAMIAGEVKKVTDNQQALNDQFVSLNAKVQSIEEKSSGFAATDQLEVIAGELANSSKVLGTVQASVATLEGKISATVQQLQAITPEKMVGDIPSRLASLEQKGEVKEFDPQPLTESLQILQKEVEELKKKNTGSTRAKKKV